MKRLTIILMALALAAGIAQAKNWCENLIEGLNNISSVDKTVAISRAPDSHEITNATYDYRFTSTKLFKQIYSTMKKHSPESDYYTESGSKNKMIMMRFSADGRTWSCKLESDSKNKQFLVSVKSGGAAEANASSSTQIMIIGDNNGKSHVKNGRNTSSSVSVSRSKSSSKSSSSSTVTVITNDDNEKTTVENHNRELRQAELERKKKLGQ